MKVSGIFKTLIVVVACVLLGALVLNILLPNAATSIVNTVEDQIYNATKLSFDFNGDGNQGSDTTATTLNNDQTGTDTGQSEIVNGF